MKVTLALYPGSTHWHFKKSNESGVLEMTVFPKHRRIWAKVQNGRQAAWIENKLPSLKEQVRISIEMSG